MEGSFVLSAVAITLLFGTAMIVAVVVRRHSVPLGVCCSAATVGSYVAGALAYESGSWTHVWTMLFLVAFSVLAASGAIMFEGRIAARRRKRAAGGA